MDGQKSPPSHGMEEEARDCIRCLRKRSWYMVNLPQIRGFAIPNAAVEKTRDELDQRGWASRHYKRHLSRLQKIRTPYVCEFYPQIKAFYEDLRSRGRAVSIKTLCVKFAQLMPSCQLSQSAIYQRIRRFAAIFVMPEDG